MTYVPHTPEDVREMLTTIGVESVDDLFASIPAEHRLDRALAIPAALSETEIIAEMARLAERNRAAGKRPSFLGAGCYRRFIPAVVDYISSRGEFATAYTPYQPEVSQGTLQAIFEYQTMLCQLTGMEISNASMYEAATALAESVLMSYSVHRKGRRVLVSEGVHPEYRRVVETYLRSHPAELVTVPLVDGRTPPSAVAEALDDETLAVVVQNPNFFGCIEDGAAIRAALDENASASPLFIAVVDPVSLALLPPPGEYGADIAVGDGQQLGNPPSFGGPSFGFFTTLQRHVRKLPGRIVGQTVDREGRTGYVLTFQTREQHIRRERATSNICTNQGLCSLRAAVYLTCVGETGLRAAASASVRKAHHAATLLSEIPGVEPVSNAPFFSEFAVRLPVDAEDAARALAESGIEGGLPLGRYFPERQNEMLIACTELTGLGDIEELATQLSSVCQQTSTVERTAR